MRTLIISEGGVFHPSTGVTELRRALTAPHSMIWLDVTAPTDKDAAFLRDEFKFHPLAIEDAVRAHERPKVDAYGPLDANGNQGATSEGQPGYYFVVFYAASYDAASDCIGIRAVNLFIGLNYLVTVHADEIPEIGEVMALWSAAGSPLNHQVGALVHALLDALVDNYFPLMDQVADRVEDLEDTIFAHFSNESIQTIFSLKKDLLNLRRVVAPERDVLNVLLRRQLSIFKPDEIAYLQDVYDHIVRVTDNVDTYRDLLSSALDSYLSLQSNNLNQVMKLLTMASIVLMTNALIAGIYGMNFHNIPELAWPFGYFWALSLMGLCTVVLVLYFRRKNWL
jgi:magnesium transporter